MGRAGETIPEVLSSKKEAITVQAQVSAALPPPCPVLGALCGDSSLCQIAETKSFPQKTQCCKWLCLRSSGITEKQRKL